MDEGIVLRAQSVSKRYGLPLPGWIQSLRKRFFARQYARDCFDAWALRDISFTLRRGESLGVIGHNGAGKSTLLKILAGVTPPTEGSMQASGRVFPMIELNAGIHADLTGRENAFLLGAIMGIPRNEMAERVAKVAEFCELDEWFDRPFRMYSSGMKTRLGFGVAMNVSADILLIDEVLAVGDAMFRRKCLKRFESMLAGGASLVFVSHAIHQVERICERAMLLDHGEMVHIGAATETALNYFEQIQKSVVAREVREGEARKAWQVKQEGNPIRLRSVRLYDGTGEETDHIRTADPLTVRLVYESEFDAEDAVLSVTISTSDNELVCGFRSEGREVPICFGREGVIRLDIPNLPLIQGTYFLSWKVIHPRGGCLGSGGEIAYFTVTTHDEWRSSGSGGFVILPGSFDMEDLSESATS